jgi:Raf kinase inhibitor-like YbhB/YbcL family protein
MAFTIRSAAFEEGGAIPVEHTCDGADRSPALSWSGAPAGTRSFALVVHDPDAPSGDWVHWVLYDVPAERGDIPAGVPARPAVEGVGTQGMNDFRRVGWGGPCPPRGPAHRYRFRLLALDAKPGLAPRLVRDALLESVRGHVLAEASMMGRYARR